MSTWLSRKLFFALASAGAILAAGKWLQVVALPEVVAGLVAVAAIYIGGNTASRWIDVKGGAIPPGTAPPEGAKPEGE